MDKEAIEARMNELQAQREQLQVVLNQATNNMIALDGAIQDCQYWLSKLEKPEEKKK